jgi:subtilisin
MRRTILLLTMVAAVLLAFSGVVLAQQGERTTPADPEQRSTPERGKPSTQDRYIVVLNDDADPGAVGREHAQRHGARVTHTYSHVFNGYAAQIPQQGVSGVQNDPRVELVDPDTLVEAFDSHLPTGVKRINTPSSGTAKLGDTTTGDNVNADIAIIDTGIDSSHPNLQGQVKGGFNCTSGNRSAWKDDNGHGTHVAGTAAAKDLGTSGSVAGVAPGASLWAYKVLNSQGSGLTSWVICGIDQVTKQNKQTTNKIEVANMSLGGSGSDGSCGSNSYHLAICKATNETDNGSTYGNYPGTLFAVAAGNSAQDFASTRPATYKQVLTVTATADSDGKWGEGSATTWQDSNCGTSSDGTTEEEESAADFSNWPVSTEDVGHTIAAPGRCITSTWPTGLGDKSGYKKISGTSMASPHVAGTAALYRASQGSTYVKPADVKSALLQAARDKFSSDASYGFKKVDKAGNSHAYGDLADAGRY